MDFIKAKPYRENEWKEPTLLLLEEKLDGIRVMLKQGSAFTRGQSINCWFDIPKHIRALALPEFVDGELFVPGRTSSEARRKDLDSLKQFRGFHLPDQRLSAKDTRLYLAYRGIDTPESHGIHETPSLDFLEQRARHFVLEGFVLKLPYSKIPVWRKYKVEETLDLMITGTNPGAGQFSGMVGSLEVSGYLYGDLIAVANVSGFNVETRRKLSKSDIGRIVEIRYQHIGARGRLVLPRFKSFRDDKTAPDKLPLDSFSARG